jgi:hypothetical protein
MRTTVLLLALSTAVIPLAAAQEPYRPGSPLGADVVVKPRRRDAGPILRGELLAVSVDSLWIVGPTTLTALPLADLAGVQVRRFRSGASTALVWGLLGGLLSGGLLTAACSTVNEGGGCAGVMVFSLITWGLWGGVGAATLSGSSVRTLPPTEPALGPYARFPQGLPPGVDRQLLAPATRTPLPRP